MLGHGEECQFARLFQKESGVEVPDEFTFGVELEIWSPLTRDELAQILQTEHGIDARDVWFTHDCTPYWKILRDATLVEGAPKGKFGMELVSPILRGYEGIRQVESIVSALNGLGVSCDERTGLHVHVGKHNDSWSVDDVRAVVLDFVKYEALFDSMMPDARRGDINPQIRSISSLFEDDYSNAVSTLSATNNAADEMDTLIDVVNSNGYGASMRYYKLNIEAFRRYGTIEFRQGSGSVEGEEVVRWVLGILKFCQRACTRGDTVAR